MRSLASPSRVATLAILPLLAMLGCGSPRSSLSAKDAVRQAAFEKGIVLLGESGLRGPYSVCVATRATYAEQGYETEDPPADLLLALRATHPQLRRASKCSFTEHRVLSPSRLRAALMWVDGVRWFGSLAIARVSYYVGPLYAAEYRCVFQLRRGQWQVRRCTVLSVS